MASIVTEITLDSGCTIQELLRIKEEVFRGVPISKLVVNSSLDCFIIQRLCDKTDCTQFAKRPLADGTAGCVEHY